MAEVRTYTCAIIVCHILNIRRIGRPDGLY